MHSSLLSLGVLASKDRGVRYGIRFKRGLSKAVYRNRLKRQLRELIRHPDFTLVDGVDLVAVIHPQAYPSRAVELNRDLVKLCLKQAILLSEKV